MRVLADARRIPLRDGCVQCVVTSPPYWGLRDYGTARWIGGDADCDHRPITLRPERNETRRMLAGSPATNAGQIRYWAARQTCDVCGAVKQDLQIGLEPTPEAYVETMVQVFREVWRVLRDDGTVWLNLGDSYANDGKWGGSSGGKHVSELHGDTGVGRGKRDTGLKPKDLVGIPWRVAFALQADGWYLRSDVIWAKPNPMPESVTDRPTKAHEYVFLLTKSERYYYNGDAIKNPPAASTLRQITEGYDGTATKDYDGAGVQNPSSVKARIIARKREKQRGHGRRHAGFNDRWDAMPKVEQIALGSNARTVWSIATQPYPGSHFATMPEKLAERCILAGSRPGDLVFDPFGGSGTTVRVARRLNRRGVMLDLNPAYLELARERASQVQVSLLDAEQTA